MIEKLAVTVSALCDRWGFTPEQKAAYVTRSLAAPSLPPQVPKAGLTGRPLIEAIVDSLCERWPLTGPDRTRIVVLASAASTRAQAADVIVAGFKAARC